MSYLQAEYRVMDELSLNVGIPWIRVSPYGDVSQTGVGDMSIGTRFQAFDSDTRLSRLLVGINVELPTGSTSKRLGHGHYEFAPMIAFAHAINNRVMLTSSVSQSFPLSGLHDHSHGHEMSAEHNHEQPLIRPHFGQETTANLGLIFATDTGFIESGLRFGAGIDDGSVIATPVDVRFQKGINLMTGVVITTGFSQTVYGDPRTPWTIDFGFSFVFQSTGINMPPKHGSNSPHEHDAHHEHDTHHKHDAQHEHDAHHHEP